jgi:hypothetical protein
VSSRRPDQREDQDGQDLPDADVIADRHRTARSGHSKPFRYLLTRSAPGASHADDGRPTSLARGAGTTRQADCIVVAQGANRQRFVTGRWPRD